MGEPFDRRLLLAGALGSCLAGCERPRVGTPPPAPRLETPAHAIPPDLDLALRVALQDLTRALGPEVVAELGAQGRLAPLDDPLVVRALKRTSVAWVGLRLGLPAASTDNVLVLTGDFSGLEINPARWSGETDLGAGWRRYQTRGVTRSQPAALFCQLEETWVLASEAEIDAVERLLAHGGNDSLEPPARGLLAVAASMPAVAAAVRDTSPRAARLLERGRRLTGHVGLGPRGLVLAANFDFEDATRAKRAADAAELLLEALRAGDGPTKAVAEGARVEALGGSVSLDVSLEGRDWLRWFASGARGEVRHG